jgi:hypothetical protein
VTRLGRFGSPAFGVAALSCAVALVVLVPFAGRFEVTARGLALSANRASPVQVAYLGPHGDISGVVRLPAAASSRGARIVAVTYLLDGKPLGSDTTPPFALDVNTGLLLPGRHVLRIVAVDSLGRSTRSRPITVRNTGAERGVIAASPSRGLTHALAALRRGGATVLLRPGHYALNDVVLGNGARLIGSGPDTVIEPSEESYFALLSVHGSDVRISDLTVDGGGAGPGDGFAIAVADGSSDVRLQRLQLERVRGDGVNIWGRHADVSVQDSSIQGGPIARAGVRALESDDSRDVSVIRTTIRNFRSYGIDFAQQAYDRPAAGLHALALANSISDIRDPARSGCASDPSVAGCGTNEAGIESGAVEAALVRNTVIRAAWDGIETVGSSTRATVVGNTIGRTRTGIYLEHSTTASVIARNMVTDSQAGINVEWRYGDIGSTRNTFAANRIVRASEVGLFLDVGADRNHVENNVFVAGARPAIVLQGSSLNIVHANRACGTKGPIVRQQDGRLGDTGRATAAGNRIADNTAGPCRG